QPSDAVGAAHLLFHLDVERIPHPADVPGLQRKSDRPRRDQRAAGRPADGRHDHKRVGTAGHHPDADLLPHLPAHPHLRHHGRSSQVMKFTDGFWQLRPGVATLYAQEAYDIDRTDDTPDVAGIVITAPTTVISKRGDTLNRPVLTTTLSSPAAGVIRVRIAHHTGRRWHGGFELPGAGSGAASVAIDETGGTLDAGGLLARIRPGAPWDLSFEVDGRRVTGSGHKAQGWVRLASDAQVDAGIVGNARQETAAPHSSTYMHEQLDLGVGELIYGLGERFGPLVKNGQSVEIWNADGGTSSEQAYKSIPFHLSNRGYGVLVNDPGHVSYEIGSEAVERVQFSVPGEVLEYFVIAGPTPKDVLERYTSLTGRAPVVPAWSYGLWLSTSFTTDYDEQTVNSFIDEMAARDLPVSVFHFDCF